MCVIKPLNFGKFLKHFPRVIFNILVKADQPVYPQVLDYTNENMTDCLLSQIKKHQTLRVCQSKILFYNKRGS